MDETQQFPKGKTEKKAVEVAMESPFGEGKTSMTVSTKGGAKTPTVELIKVTLQHCVREGSYWWRGIAWSERKNTQTVELPQKDIDYLLAQYFDSPDKRQKSGPRFKIVADPVE